MKIFNLLFAIIFLFFAALQYNDPDPYVWIPIYGYGVVFCWLAFRNKFYPRVYLLGIAIFAIYAGYKFFEQDGVLDWIKRYNMPSITGSMQAETPWVEETREFFGLLIVIAVLLIDYFYGKKFLAKHAKEQSR